MDACLVIKRRLEELGPASSRMSYTAIQNTPVDCIARVRIPHYREMLLGDVERRFGKVPLRSLLEPAALQEIFGGGAPVTNNRMSTHLVMSHTIT